MHQSALFTEDFPANPSPWLDGREDKLTTDISGQSFRGLSPTLCRVGSSLKMYLASCPLPRMTFVRIWSAKATKSRYGILKLRLSDRRTEGHVSFLWATPTAANAKGTTGGGPRAKDLRQDVRVYPTPRASDGKGAVTREAAEKALERGYGPNLAEYIQLFPPPTANDAKNNGAPSQHERNSAALNVVAGGALNPDWVEWLMGFPPGWTELSGGEKNPTSQESPEESQPVYSV